MAQGLCRVVIGVQLVIVGFQLPAKYQLHRWKEMLLCLIPNMTLMWLCTSGCILLAIPNLNFVSLLLFYFFFPSAGTARTER
jgi:NhaP-type Na+/H+ or K+/H+ antiporter